MLEASPGLNYFNWCLLYVWLGLLPPCKMLESLKSRNATTFTYCSDNVLFLHQATTLRVWLRHTRVEPQQVVLQDAGQDPLLPAF